MTDNDKAREEFEDLFCSDDCEVDFSREATGEYKDESVQGGWIAFEYQQEIIESQRRTIEERDEYIQRIAEKVGVCGAGKCSADMWADPPRDCSAPDCLDIDKGIEQLQSRVNELEEKDAILYDSYKVYTCLKDEGISPAFVSSVLDAVVRLQKSITPPGEQKV